MAEAYVKPQALVDYLNRIGAEELSFRRFMVKEYRGIYYTEKALIRIQDGKIKCSAKEYAPTDEERDAIEKALINVEFPHSVGARRADDLLPLLKNPGEIYEVWDRATDLIVMVQQSCRKENGTKYYPVWSKWSDGKWRCMEPDGKLPFWKPRTRTQAARLMIHEGAKAAKYVQEEIVEAGGAGHPWADDLCLYEHWGMLGGALAPHRSLYTEIAHGAFIQVVYACDNDKPGQWALQEVSKNYGRAMKGFRPDNTFPESWDMADPMPKKSFSGTRWVGKNFQDLLVPATWATETIPPKDGKKGKNVVVIKRDFREEWVHCVTPEVFVHTDWPSQFFTTQEFNNRVAPYSDVRDPAALLRRDDTSKGAVMVYSPADPPGVGGSRKSGRQINTHVPCIIKPEKGDITKWTEFLEYLIPIEVDRKHLMRWLATLISRPDIKVLYGVLLISETQGVGKGTLGEKILAPLMGEGNASFPSEQEIVDSNYNYWLAHKRLAVVHEIYAGHSAKAYNRLKSIITDHQVSVSKKYMASYEIENWIHVLACSNSIRAIQLSNEDRRWFVPLVAEKKKPPSYWVEFNRWLSEEGGLAKIKWWADEFVKNPDNVIASGEPAPWSTLKAEVIKEGRSITERFISDLLRSVAEVEKEETEQAKATKEMWKTMGCYSEEDGVIVLDAELQHIVRHKFYGGRYDERLLRLSTIRRVAKEEGWFPGTHRAKWSKDWHTEGLDLSQLLVTKPHMRVLKSSTDSKIRALTAKELADL